MNHIREHVEQVISKMEISNDPYTFVNQIRSLISFRILPDKLSPEHEIRLYKTYEKTVRSFIEKHPQMRRKDFCYDYMAPSCVDFFFYLSLLAGVKKYTWLLDEKLTASLISTIHRWGETRSENYTACILNFEDVSLKLPFTDFYNLVKCFHQNVLENLAETLGSYYLRMNFILMSLFFVENPEFLEALETYLKTKYIASGDSGLRYAVEKIPYMKKIHEALWKYKKDPYLFADQIKIELARNVTEAVHPQLDSHRRILFDRIISSLKYRQIRKNTFSLDLDSLTQMAREALNEILNFDAEKTDTQKLTENSFVLSSCINLKHLLKRLDLNVLSSKNAASLYCTVQKENEWLHREIHENITRNLTVATEEEVKHIIRTSLESIENTHDKQDDSLQEVIESILDLLMPKTIYSSVKELKNQIKKEMENESRSLYPFPKINEIRQKLLEVKDQKNLDYYVRRIVIAAHKFMNTYMDTIIVLRLLLEDFEKNNPLAFSLLKKRIIRTFHPFTVLLIFEELQNGITENDLLYVKGYLKMAKYLTLLDYNSSGINIQKDPSKPIHFAVFLALNGKLISNLAENMIHSSKEEIHISWDNLLLLARELIKKYDYARSISENRGKEGENSRVIQNEKLKQLTLFT